MNRLWRSLLLSIVACSSLACGPQVDDETELEVVDDSTTPALPRPQAEIFNISAPRARPGDVIFITGRGFSTYPQPILTVGGVQASIVRLTDNAIHFRVPTGAAAGHVTLRDANMWMTAPYGCAMEGGYKDCSPVDGDCDPRAEGVSCLMSCIYITQFECKGPEWSNVEVASAQIRQVPVRSTIQNRTRFPLRSLVLNGVEQIPANQVLPHGNDWVIEDFPTNIRVQATSVYFDPLEGRYLDHYVFDWTMSSPFNLTLAPPPLTEQLSRFAQFAGTRLGSNWQITVSFQFYANGQFEYFEDEQRLITGRYAETGAQATTRYGILQYNLNGVPTSASFEFEETRGLLTLTINNERVTLVGR